MKERIIGIMCYPYPDKYVIAVTRGDGKHIPHTRVYMARYSEPDKVRRLAKLFISGNSLLQFQIVEYSIERYNAKS